MRSTNLHPGVPSPQCLPTWGPGQGFEPRLVVPRGGLVVADLGSFLGVTWGVGVTLVPHPHQAWVCPVPAPRRVHPGGRSGARAPDTRGRPAGSQAWCEGTGGESCCPCLSVQAAKARLGWRRPSLATGVLGGSKPGDGVASPALRTSPLRRQREARRGQLQRSHPGAPRDVRGRGAERSGSLAAARDLRHTEHFN